MRLPEALPITKIKLQYKKRTNQAQPFIAREIIEQDFGAEKIVRPITESVTQHPQELTPVAKTVFVGVPVAEPILVNQEQGSGEIEIT